MMPCNQNAAKLLSICMVDSKMIYSFSIFNNPPQLSCPNPGHCLANNLLADSFSFGRITVLESKGQYMHNLRWTSNESGGETYVCS